VPSYLASGLIDTLSASPVAPCWCRSFARAFSTAAPGAAPAAPPPAPERTVFGGLKDQDRIFTNIYGRHDPFMKVREGVHVGDVFLRLFGCGEHVTCMQQSGMSSGCKV